MPGPRLAAEKGLEDVVEAAKPKAFKALALRRVVPKLVVHLALLGVAENLVGLIDLLELRLGIFTLVDVRVVLPSETPEGLLDVVLGGGTSHPEDLIVVPFLSRRH